MTLKVQLITAREFDRLKDEWNELLDRSVCDSVFLRWEWIHTWWSIFKKHRTLFILAARQDGRLAGIAPFYIEKEGLLETRILKFCSEELSPDYMDVFTEKGQEAEVARAIMNEVFFRARAWDVIALDNLRVLSPLLADPALFSGYVVSKHVSQICPYVKITGSFDDYYKARPELLSYSLEKKLKKLREEPNFSHRVVRDEASLSKAIDDLFLLHEKRAEAKKMHSNFLSADIKRFHHELSRLFLKEGLLNFQLLYSAEIPVAARYDFTYKNKLVSYQNGFDPEWKKWSVGAVMIYLMMEEAFKNRLDEFDFLKGTESYKSLWSNGVHDEMRLTVFNKNLRGTFCRMMNEAQTALRKMKNRLLIRHTGESRYPEQRSTGPRLSSG